MSLLLRFSHFRRVLAALPAFFNGSLRLCQETTHSAAFSRWDRVPGLDTLLPLTLKEKIMGLFRVLFWIALIAAAFWLWRRFTRSRSTTSSPRPQAEPMVRCAHCQVHLPQHLALQQDNQWYCSQAHLEQARHDQ